MTTPAPIGVTQPTAEPSDPIRVVAGDTIRLRRRVLALDGHPAIPENSRLVFALSDQRFSTTPLWLGYWRAGIETLDANGLVEIRLPDAVTSALRRGDYVFALQVADVLDAERRTVWTGSLLVEYEPVSPHRNIPYKET